MHGFFSVCCSVLRVDDEVDLWELQTGSGNFCVPALEVSIAGLSAGVGERSNWALCRNQQCYTRSYGEDKNLIPRHFKTIQEFGYCTSVFYLGTFVIFIFILFLNHSASVATIKGLENSSLFITSCSRRY